MWLLPSEITAALTIFTCAYLIRGGDYELFDGPLPGARFWGLGLSTLAFASWQIILGLSYYLIPIYAAGWFFTIAFAWESYYSIGSSTSIRRPCVAWIDWLLLHTWGPLVISAAGVTTNSALWRVGRDATGMFLRMMYCLPLFLALGEFSTPGWYICIPAIIYGLAFSFMTVLCYAGYNWLPWFTYGDKELDWAEFSTGLVFGAMVMTFTYYY